MTNVEKLGKLLNTRMKTVSRAAAGIGFELGVMKGSSLSTDSFQDVIPKGDYMVNEDIKDLKSGNRVLVVWCGNEPVVVCKIKSS